MVLILFCYLGPIGPAGPAGISGVRLVTVAGGPGAGAGAGAGPGAGLGAGAAGAAGGGIVRCAANEVGLGCTSSAGCGLARPDLRTCKEICGYGGYKYAKYGKLTLVCARVDNGRYGHKY